MEAGRTAAGRSSCAGRLQVPPDAGLELGGGDRCSIAFALWDGAAHDRDGQKLVSIWHDLELE